MAREFKRLLLKIDQKITWLYIWTHRKKSELVKSGYLNGQARRPSLPIDRLGNIISKKILNIQADVCRRTIKLEPHSRLNRMQIVKNVWYDFPSRTARHSRGQASTNRPCDLSSSLFTFRPYLFTCSDDCQYSVHCSAT